MRSASLVIAGVIAGGVACSGAHRADEARGGASASSAGVAGGAPAVSSAGRSPPSTSSAPGGGPSSGTSPTPPDANAPSPGGATSAGLFFDDEFDGAHTLASYVDAFPSRHEVLDIGASRVGVLTLIPAAAAGPGNTWYADDVGPFIHTSVSGDFVVETSVKVGTRASADVPPSGAFNAAGLLVRAPDSVPGDENWIMYNLGYQSGFFAREAKTTERSLSTLYLDGTQAHSGRLRICRVGDTFRLFHLLDGETAWQEESHDGATVVMGNGPQPAPGVTASTIAFVREGSGTSTALPTTLDVGIMAGSWSAPLDVRGEFDYLRIWRVQSADACSAP